MTVIRDLGVPTGGVPDEDAVDGVFWRGPCGRSLCFDVRVTDQRGREGVDAAWRRVTSKRHEAQ